MTTLEETKKGDENTENIRKLKPKRSPNQLIVAGVKDIVQGEGDNSCVILSVPKMEEMGLYGGDSLLVKGKKRSQTVCIALANEQTDDNTIRMNGVIRKNLRVKIGDIVSIHSAGEVPYGTSVKILPFKDTVQNINVNSLFDKYLKGYFQDSYRPIMEGDCFTVSINSKSVEFKVVEVEVKNDSDEDCCIVAPETVIYCTGDPIQRTVEIGYEDIGGMGNVLPKIKDIIELSINHINIFGTFGVKPTKGLLLYGPSGVGKTLIAKAIANETGVFFFVVNGPEIYMKTPGDSENALIQIFDECAKNHPSILFIDEIDSIASTRNGTDPIKSRMVSMLSTLMDGLKDRGDIIVIGATNRINMIDPVLRRFGRFDNEIEIPIPDTAGRLEILRIHTRQMKLAKNVNLKAVAENTEGFVGADLAQICTEAAIYCIRDRIKLNDTNENTILDDNILNKVIIQQSHFEKAVKVVSSKKLRTKTETVQKSIKLESKSYMDSSLKNNYATEFKFWLCNTVKKENYLELFSNEEYNDVRLIQDFDEEELLSLGIKKLHVKLILRHVKEFKNKMESFMKWLKDNKLDKYRIYLNSIGVITLESLIRLLVKIKKDPKIISSEVNTSEGIPLLVIKRIYHLLNIDTNYFGDDKSDEIIYM